jgi:hypothetical protein
MIHEALLPELNQIIAHDLQYSDDDLTALDRLRAVTFAGWSLTLPEYDKWLYSTTRGVVAQIDRFHAEVGIIYWIAIHDGRCEMKKTLVRKTPSTTDHH